MESRHGFNISIRKKVITIQIPPHQHREGTNLLLALIDEVDLIGNTRIKIKEAFIRFEEKAEKMELLNKTVITGTETKLDRIVP